MSRSRYWFAGTLTACCLALAANAQVVSQVVNTVAISTGVTGLGTSVATALGVSVGSSGAVLIKGTSVCADLSNGGTGCAATLGNATGNAALNTIASWTPADGSGASLVFTGVTASSTRLGNMLLVYARLSYPVTANGSAAVISGLPVNVANSAAAFLPCIVQTGTNFGGIQTRINSASLDIFTTSAFTVTTTNAQLSGAQIQFLCIYPAS